MWIGDGGGDGVVQALQMEAASEWKQEERR